MLVCEVIWICALHAGMQFLREQRLACATCWALASCASAVDIAAVTVKCNIKVSNDRHDSANGYLMW